MHHQAFWLPKGGNSAEEYEDAFAANPQRGAFAVADGATESSFAGAWARLLVEGFVNEPARQLSQWPSWLPPLQARWDAEVGQQELPWFAMEKLDLGAFATFLGITVEENLAKARKVWKAVAVGDSCLFLVRDGELRLAFPVNRSSAFGNNPALVCSRQPAKGLIAKRKFRVRKGRWRPEDRLWLMTDALALWFLQRHEAGERPWQIIAALLESTPETFANWIGELRARREMRNDDVTLLAVTM